MHQIHGNPCKSIITFFLPTHSHYEGIYLIINYFNPLYRKLYSTPYKITIFNFYHFFFQIKNYIIFSHAIKYATGKAWYVKNRYITKAMWIANRCKLCSTFIYMKYMYLNWESGYLIVNNWENGYFNFSCMTTWNSKSYNCLLVTCLVYCSRHKKTYKTYKTA